MYATLFDDPDLINQMLPRYLAVTSDDIRSISAEVFREDNRVILTYLPELAPADAASEADPEADEAVEDEEVAA
jgi:hypothetical protein